MNAFLYLKTTIRSRSPPVLTLFQMKSVLEMEDRTISQKQSGMVEKIFDTYHADYFQVMGYEIGIVDGDLAQALKELPDKKYRLCYCITLLV